MHQNATGNYRIVTTGSVRLPYRLEYEVVEKSWWRTKTTWCVFVSSGWVSADGEFESLQDYVVKDFKELYNATIRANVVVGEGSV